jgi:hypothetical protein
MLKQINSKRQGNVGIARAILWYTERGHIISLPLTDSQSYDLIVDENGILKRVQVKTATSKRYDSYIVHLRSMSNVKGAKLRIKFLSEDDADLVFIATEEDNYIIPIKIIAGMSMITLSHKYDEYRI